MKLAKLFTAIALTLSAAAGAQTPLPPVAATAAAPARAMTDGEVRKIDKAQGKVTLRHGPIANLDMPSMTMVFKVASPQFLDGVKEGDKVKFTADKISGSMTVTAIEAAR